PGTSLPVGGESTHCVISGHRGLPSAQLFTDIDQLKIGDTFMLQILDQTLYYEVDQIKTVLPTEKDDLKIVEGQDYCTLMTCTPYGVNTHRLLVRGHRINKTNLRVRRDLVKVDFVLIDVFWILLAFILAFIWYLTSKKHKER
uniref:class C sortase n=1 Tax=Catenibacterium faecis TaxID=2764323 RepID=UPI003F819DA4